MVRHPLVPISTCCFVMLMLGIGYANSVWSIAVYSLSFWHYYIYALAYCYGSITLTEFQRDALLTKMISMVVIAVVYLAEPLDVISLVVMSSGFVLNLSAFMALGIDRTYYGYELGQIAAKEVTRFPYSWIPHPMLVGNIIAFGGIMLNSEFRHRWWPLAAAHVSLNVAILLMEQYLTARLLGERGRSVDRRHRSPLRTALRWSGMIAVLFAVVASTLIDWQRLWEAVLMVLSGAVFVAVYAFVVCRRYVMAAADAEQPCSRK